MIGEVLTRCCQISGVDEVVCSIPFGEFDLGEEAAKYCSVMHGPEQDVLSRYVMAAGYFKADLIMRITGDCPHLSPELCGTVLALAKLDWTGYTTFEQAKADYTSNIIPRTFPKGLDCEVFTKDVLRRADGATPLSEREHVTPWMQRSEYVRRRNTYNSWPMDGRLTLDTEEDYKVICAAFGHEPYQHLRAA